MEPQPVNVENGKYTIPLAIIIAGALVSAAIYFGGGSPTVVGSNNNTVTKDIDLAPLTDKDHLVGSPDAEVIVYEYSDTECPFCKVYHETMKQVVRDYEGKVSWVYRHFPIAKLHSKAIKEAEATECANELGGNQVFWNYINKLFETTKSNNQLDASELPKIAVAVGLDQKAFNTCLSSGRHNAFILASVDEAIKAGARGTPYSIAVNQDGDQIVINGAEPILKVKEKIDALLD